MQMVLQLSFSEWTNRILSKDLQSEFCIVLLIYFQYILIFLPTFEEKVWVKNAGGKPLLELNRLLRPGGFFVWSATPVYQHDERHRNVWNC